MTIRFLVLLVAFFLLAGCQPAKTTPETTPLATVPPLSIIEKILAEPESFNGQQVTLEGTLEMEGQGLKAVFFLRDESGARLKVSSWAPLEVMHPPQGKTSPRSMVSYVGRFLRLRGTVQVNDAGVFLQTTAVAEP